MMRYVQYYCFSGLDPSCNILKRRHYILEYRTMDQVQKNNNIESSCGGLYGYIQSSLSFAFIKAVPRHAMEAHGGRGGIALIHT
jgi:hypothetical protein